MNADFLPRARRTGIVEQIHEGEILIYDLDTHRAYNLNPTLAIVYRHCDGQTARADLMRRHRLAEDAITLAIDELRRSDLLEMNDAPAPLSRISRREAIRRAGMTSLVALPLLTMLAAPRAAHANSLTNLICATPRGQVCAQFTDCNQYCATAFNSSCTCTLNCCVECANPQIVCNNVCTNVQADPNNCGSCGNVCPDVLDVCVNGNCIGTV